LVVPLVIVFKDPSSLFRFNSIPDYYYKLKSKNKNNIILILFISFFSFNSQNPSPKELNIFVNLKNKYSFITHKYNVILVWIRYIYILPKHILYTA